MGQIELFIMVAMVIGGLVGAAHSLLGIFVVAPDKTTKKKNKEQKKEEEIAHLEHTIWCLDQKIAGEELPKYLNLPAGIHHCAKCDKERHMS